MYAFNNGEVKENPPIFMEHILEELIHEEDQDGNGGNYKRNDKELKRNKKDKKKSKKSVFFKS